MSEEVIENSEVVEENVIQNEEVIEKPEEVVEEKPWKKEKKVPEHIPYDRFSSVVAEKNAEKIARENAEKRAAEYEAKIKAYEESQNKVKTYTNIDEIMKDADNMSFEDLMAQVAKVTEQKIFSEFEQKEKAKEQQREIEKVQSEFESRINSVKERIPDIEEAIDYLATYSSKIHPALQEKLIKDEYGPELAYRIASDEKLLDIFVNGNPADSLTLIGELKAEIKYASKAVVKEEPMEIKPYKPMTPKVGANSTTVTNRIPDNLSMSEYRKLRQQGLV